jgi:hypothetical protein
MLIKNKSKLTLIAIAVCLTGLAFSACNNDDGKKETPAKETAAPATVDSPKSTLPPDSLLPGNGKPTPEKPAPAPAP